jgi:hypothetical protein
VDIERDVVELDPDIEAILEQVRSDSVRSTEAYRLGALEATAMIHGERLSDIKEKMVLPAEMFYRSLQKLVPAEAILQHRIGTDYTTGVPTVLSVVSKEYIDKMPEIDMMERELELYLFHELDCDCNLWTMTDRNIEQSLVEQDFPCYRRKM